MSSRAQEGVKFMADGEKSLNKSSFFGKKKPDYDSAGQSFEAAANCFRAAQVWDQAVDAFRKLAECHRQLDSIYLAAKAIESAASIAAQQLKNPVMAADLYSQCSQFFQAQGSPDRAGESLDKAAKILSQSSPEAALEKYEEACNLYEEENKMRFGVDTFKAAIALAIQLDRFDYAFRISERLSSAFIRLDQKPNYNKQILSMIIMALFKNDVDHAYQLQQNVSNVGFESSQEGRIASSLIEAVTSANGELLANQIKCPEVSFLHPEIGKLAHRLKVASQPLATNKAMPPPPVEQPVSEELQQLQDDIEEEGFL